MAPGQSPRPRERHRRYPSVAGHRPPSSDRGRSLPDRRSSSTVRRSSSPDGPSSSTERRSSLRGRRTFLAGVGSVAVAATAGCLGGPSSGEPRYGGYERGDLIPGVDAFPDGWEERPDLNEDYVVYGGPDGRVFVGLDAEVLPDVDAAAAAFSETRDRMRRPEEHALADEAFWDEVDGDYALTVFRHSNALGQTFALRDTGEEVEPDRTRSQRFAEEMYQHWRGL